METLEGDYSSLGSISCAGALEQSYSSWAELNLFGLDADLVSPADLEDIYAEIHKSVDQAVSAISQKGIFTPETIKQQNRKVIEKLAGLENATPQHTPLTLTSSLSGTIPAAITLKTYLNQCATVIVNE